MGEIKVAAFNHVENLGVRDFEDKSSGDIMTTLTKDIDNVEAIYMEHLRNLTFAIIHGSVAIVAMVSMNLILAAIAVFLGLSSVYVNYLISKRVKIWGHRYQQCNSIATENIIDIEEGFVDIKMGSSEQHFYDKYEDISNEIRKSYVGREKFMSLLSTANTFYSYLNRIGLLAIGIYMVFIGHTDIGTVLAIIHLQGNASFLFQNISSFLGGIQKSIPSVDRLFNLLDMCLEDDEKVKGEKLNKNHLGEIKIKDLTFSYESNVNILEEVSMTIEPGEFIGIVGESGCGKSTFIKILLGFYNGVSGDITINGVNKNSLSLREFRNNIAYVPQDCHLFSGTIEENIRYGNQNATMEDVKEASKMANAHEFIMAMDNGYATMLDELGENISGGQKQRIAIARALLSSANILIMDEVTSALDSDTEELIKGTLDKLRGDKTIIVVSHKYSTIAKADRIYQFKDGKVEENVC